VCLSQASAFLWPAMWPALRYRGPNNALLMQTPNMEMRDGRCGTDEITPKEPLIKPCPIVSDPGSAWSVRLKAVKPASCGLFVPQVPVSGPCGHTTPPLGDEPFGPDVEVDQRKTGDIRLAFLARPR
jgi:hypothetical protein